MLLTMLSLMVITAVVMMMVMVVHVGYDCICVRWWLRAYERLFDGLLVTKAKIVDRVWISLGRGLLEQSHTLNFVLLDTVSFKVAQCKVAQSTGVVLLDSALIETNCTACVLFHT